MQKEPIQDWVPYLSLMEQVLEVELDAARRAELLKQFQRIANIAAPLLSHEFEERQEIAGVYKP